MIFDQRMASYPFQNIGLRPPSLGKSIQSSQLGFDIDIDTIIQQVMAYLEIFSSSAKSITQSIQAVADEAQAAGEQVEEFVVRANTFFSRATIFGIILLIMVLIGLILLGIIAYRTGYHPIIQAR